MIYLIDRGFRIKSALNILVNQCKYPGIYNECFCLSFNVNQGTDSVPGMPTCFADDLRSRFANNADDLRSSLANNVNDKDNDNVNVNDNDNVDDNDNNSDNVIDNTIGNVIENVNVSDNDNDLRSSFANQGTCFADDNFIYLFGEKHQKSKSNSNSNSNIISNGEILVERLRGWTKSYSPTNSISVNINEDLQSWLNDDDIITEAKFPDIFRCITSGPSECGKTFLLKKLILASKYFDKLYIIGLTGDQNQGIC